MTKSTPVEILVATSNEGKVREIKHALEDLSLQFSQLRDFPSLHLVDEVGGSYEENATLKAMYYASQTGLRSIADDSGLEVDALGGLPGLRSARFGGVGLSDSMRNQLLLASLAETKTSNRTARFVSFIALAEPESGSDQPARILKIAKGSCAGTITFNPRGENGFGYDSIFVPQGYQETFGELSEDVKSRISHRAQALLQLRLYLMTGLSKLDPQCNDS